MLTAPPCGSPLRAAPHPARACHAQRRLPARASPAPAPVDDDDGGPTPDAASLRHALREWASVVAALAAGEATVLLRKGGLADAGFRVPSRSFLLYPSSFHNQEALLEGPARRFAAAAGVAPGDDAPIAALARITGLWSVACGGGGDGARLLAALRPHHPWADGLLETRFAWRPGQAVTVLELRAWRVAGAPLVLAGSDAHRGCKSWIDVPAGALAVPGGGGGVVLEPALVGAALAARRAALRAALAALPGVTELPLPGA